MMAILVSIFAMTACQKDKADDTWKQLPVGQISVESGKATISVNDIPCNYGNVQLVADSDDAATLTLTGVVPGYNDVKVSVMILSRSRVRPSCQLRHQLLPLCAVRMKILVMLSMLMDPSLLTVRSK